MKVLVLGATGMLGHVVAKAFIEAGHNTIVAARPPSRSLCGTTFKDAKFYGIQGLDESSVYLMLSALKPNLVINCIGAIPQQNPDPYSYVEVNAMFPWALAGNCHAFHIPMLHATTDCVYDGQKGAYTEDDPFTAQDRYGRSKALGEPDTAMVLRTSIVGPELHHHTSLLAWAKAQKGQTVQGWDHHRWNGLTTRELARCFLSIMEEGLYEQGTFHIHSPQTLSKYEMLCLFSDRFSLDLLVERVTGDPVVDKSLATVKPLLGRLGVGSFEEQLERL